MTKITIDLARLPNETTEAHLLRVGDLVRQPRLEKPRSYTPTPMAVVEPTAEELARTAAKAAASMAKLRPKGRKR